MLKVKSFVALVIFAVLFSFMGTSFAKDYPGDRAGRKADYLYKKLSLTTDQYTKIYQSFLSYELKIDDLQKAKKDKVAYKDELTKLKASESADVEKLLNKDQVTKFAAIKDKMCKMNFKKKVRKPKTETTEGTEKKEEKKDVKKEEKKEVKKETKKEDKKDVKKEEKKEEKKK
jgi:hypothetical protein